jgi:transglutaminase-like putative cysteine protease
VRLEYVTAPYPQLTSPAPRSWLEPTFVVDFEEDSVARLRDKFVRAHGGQVSGRALTDFISAEVSESKYRGWDVASVAASRLEGDCTEHAVLLAALARSMGLKARVAVGVALVSTAAGHAAYGHAWTELEEGGRWVVADAALPGQQAQVRYMPLGLLIDEGPGYSLELVRISNHWVQRVIVLGQAQ